MSSVSLDSKGLENVWWCPSCGSLEALEGHTFVPEVVRAARRLVGHDAMDEVKAGRGLTPEEFEQALESIHQCITKERSVEVKE